MSRWSCDRRGSPAERRGGNRDTTRGMTRPGPLLLVLSTITTACGGDSGSTIDAPGPTNDGPDRIDAPTIDAPAACGSVITTEMTCSGTCVDTAWDPAHCGDCLTTCMGAETACVASDCVIPLSTTWEKHWGGQTFGDYLGDVAVDASGNVYVVSTFHQADVGGGVLTAVGGTDFLVASFTATGAHRWSKRFGGTGFEQGTGIVTDGTNVYVSGSFGGTVDFGAGPVTELGFGDAFALTLTASSGGFVAVKTFGTAGNDAAIEIGVDAGNNVTVCGIFDRGTMDLGGGSSIMGPGELNAFVASFAPAGTHRWSRRLNGTVADEIAECEGLAVDAAGNVTVSGDLSEPTDFGFGTVTPAANGDAYVASYTSTGAPRWARLWGSGGADTADALAVDASGNVLAAGRFTGTVDFGTGPQTAGGSFAVYVIALDGAAGTTRFVRPLDDSAFMAGIAADPAGHPIVVGSLSGTADLGTGALAPLGESDVFALGVDRTTGTSRFARRLGGAGFDGARAIAVGPGGAMIIGGDFEGSADLGTGTVTGGAESTPFVIQLAPHVP